MATLKSRLSKVASAVTERFGFLAATLPELPPAKPPNKQQSLPSYKTQVRATETVIQRPDARLATTQITDLRFGRNTQQIISDLASASPDLSAATSSYIRLGIPENYTCVARDRDGRINTRATQVAHELLRRFTFLGDPTQGTFNQQGLQSMSESAALELLHYGEIIGEIVLDKARLPTTLTLVSTTTVEYKDDDAAIPKGVKPVQKIGGVEIDLDYPTVIIVSLDQSLKSAYAKSYFESAIQPVLADAEFMQDLRRVLKRSIHPRLIASIVEEKARKLATPEILNDPEKLKQFYVDLMEQVEDVVNGANPEDAFVGLDYVQYDFAKGGHQDSADTVKAVQAVMNSKLATGAKTMPVVLGHTDSSNASSTQSLLYLKNADMVRRKLNEFYSRVLTTAVRLFGEDIYVEFIYESLDLRPRGELEAFKAMEQSRILDLLSIGYMVDEEACIKLTGNLPPAGYKPLSGTMFRQPQPVDSQNPASNTSNMNKAPTGREPATPTQPKTSRT